MAEFFLPRYPTTYTVVDLTTINRGFSTVARELQGKLNEHNFKQDFVSTRDWLDADVFARVYSESTPVDPDIDYGVTPNAIPVSTLNTWQVVRDYEFQARGGAVWVMYSCQIDPGDTSMGDYPDGLQLAIRVNGAVVWESCTGTGDFDQDQIVLHEGGDFPYRGMNTYGCTYQNCHVVEALVPVNGERCYIEVLAMAGAKSLRFRPDYIASNELIVIDLVQ